MPIGIVGRKLGMTQIFKEDGTVIPVTVISAEPGVVLEVKTKEKHGYCAIKVGFESANPYKMKKPILGQFKKAGVKPKKIIKEFRLSEEECKSFKVGDEISINVLNEGGIVDVTGWSKGRGFTGVIKRHNFSGADAGHGTHEYFRHPGSIGMCEFPGRVFKGKKLPGHWGNERVTVKNLKVEKILSDENCILIKGAVPGARKGLLIIKKKA